jgi:hypothetical protein
VDDAHDGPYAREPQVEDLVRICRALNEAQAQYILIGGFAVILHGGAAQDASTVTIDGVAIPVASAATLIRTKDTIRPSDAVDRRYLEELLRAEREQA